MYDKIRAPYPEFVAELVVPMLCESPSILIEKLAIPAQAIKSPAVSSGSPDAIQPMAILASAGIG